MKICAFSDTHGILPSLPECDVCVIAGDIIPLDIQRNYESSIAWLAGAFCNWCKNQKCKIVLIPGNHDFVFEKLYDKYMKAHYEFRYDALQDLHDDIFLFDYPKQQIFVLIDTDVTIDGVTFFGTPHCPALRNWAFYNTDDELKNMFKCIPDCDVLITHCPPKIGTQGVVLQDCYNKGNDFGCQELQDGIKDKKIDWVISGHIHSGNHEVEEYVTPKGARKYVNVSLLDEGYNKAYNPFVFEINK